MEFEALIFDLDGTLWNTVDVCTDAWNHVLKSAGMDRVIDPLELAGCMGRSSEEIREILFPNRDETAARHLINQCFVEEEKFLRERGGHLYPYVAEGIPLLAQDFQLFIVSNCQWNYLDAFLDLSKLRPYFRDAECFGRTQFEKSRNIRMIMDRNGIQRAAYIGDTIWDAEAAAKADVAFFYASYGLGGCAPKGMTRGNFDNFITLVRKISAFKAHPERALVYAHGS